MRLQIPRARAMDQRLEGSSSKRPLPVFLEGEPEDDEDEPDEEDGESLLELWLPGNTFCTA